MKGRKTGGHLGEWGTKNLGSYFVDYKLGKRAWVGGSGKGPLTAGPLLPGQGYQGDCGEPGSQ